MTSRTESPRLRPSSSENIWNAVQARVRSCGPNDTLLVSLSGHGIQFSDEEEISPGVKETYFCPENADLADKSTLLPISKLMELIEQSAASRKLLLVDACRNEVVSPAGKSKSSARRIELGSVHETEQIVPGGISVLFSCTNNQFSWESTDLGHSVFSYYVAEYIKGNAPVEMYSDGQITLDGLVYFVRKRTNDFVFDQNLSNQGQSPVLRGETENWPLARIELSLDDYIVSPDDLLEAHVKLDIGNALLAKGIKLLQDRNRVYDGIETLKKAFENDAYMAGAILGSIYSEGRQFGIAQNPELAKQWLEKAAEKGDSFGVRGLGLLHAEGIGVDKKHPDGDRFL